VVRPNARQPLQTLGRALSNEQMNGTVFLVNGHTDAVGGVDFNQDLSERRAEAVKRILIQEFRLPAGTLIAVGYGKTQLKNTTNPFAAENRRVQIVNTEQRTTARDKAPE
jgi:outer membrane protein OmpA-like peptidoglycan-associated protein